MSGKNVIYDNLLIPGTQESYSNAIRLFDEHFKPKSNISCEIYTFRRIKQNADETISKFFIRIKQQAVKCDFGENLNNEIKQQMILATTSNQLRRYCFQNPDITLEEFLTYARTLEDAESKAAEVDKGLPDEPADVSKLQKRRTYGGNKSFRGKNQTIHKKYCFRCGGDYPHQRSCPAQKKTCIKCQKKGHFALCCWSKSSQLRCFVDGVVDPSYPLSCEVDLESNDDDENILFALTNLFDGFSCIRSPNITEIFNVEGDKYDNDRVILK